MPQIVKLRRSSISGNKPDISQLSLGEVAINTYDGKMFLKKSSSFGESIEEFIISNALNTGSFTISGSNHTLIGNTTITGSLKVTNGITGSLFGTASWAINSISSSYANLSNIQYVTNSIQSLSQIEVLDYDANVAVDFTNGRLKFIFGAPATHSISSFSFNSTFDTDRFNQIFDAYTASAAWSNGGYTLISASIFEGSVLLSQTGTGTSLIFPTSTSGSHTYNLFITASNPSDGSILIKSASLAGTLAKTNPAAPLISSSATVQLGAASNQIEQGATGSVDFSASYSSANSWDQINLNTVPSSSPIVVVNALTGSASIVVVASASYQSPSGNNIPQLNTVTSSSVTYTKIRSLRGGSSPSSSFSVGQLHDLSLWNTSVGSILKGTTTASGQSVTITWSGDRYHYIVYNGSLAFLSNITAGGFGVLSAFTSSSVGEYKVYRTNLLQAGGASTTIIYALT
jgi:hypothetical protein